MKPPLKYYMRWIILGLVLIGLMVPMFCHAQESRPLLVLQESATWIRNGEESTMWTLGHRNPVFVLYADGTVIFKKGKDQYQLYTVKLSPEDAKAFLSQLNVEFFEMLEDDYEASSQLDQPVSLIMYNRGRGRSPETVRVVGNIRDDALARSNTPEPFLNIFDVLIAFDRADASPYEPKWVDIRIIPYTDAEGTPFPWPASWPDQYHADSKNVTETFGHEAYRIRFPGEQLPDLEALLSLGYRQPVLIHDRQWLISPERFRLPGEELWFNN